MNIKVYSDPKIIVLFMVFTNDKPKNKMNYLI